MKSLVKSSYKLHLAAIETKWKEHMLQDPILALQLTFFVALAKVLNF
jgi:hypothetical protein